MGAKYQHKLTGNLRLTDIARAISSQSWDFVRAVQDTLNAFLASADDSITIDHVPSSRLKNERMKRAAGKIVASADHLWTRMLDVRDTSVLQTHDGYQKAWALTRPDLSKRFDIGVWGAMEPKTNVSSESHRKGAFRSPAHPPGITL